MKLYVCKLCTRTQTDVLCVRASLDMRGFQRQLNASADRHVDNRRVIGWLLSPVKFASATQWKFISRASIERAVICFAISKVLLLSAAAANSCHRGKELHRKSKTRQSVQATGYDATEFRSRLQTIQPMLVCLKNCSARKAIFHSSGFLCHLMSIEFPSETMKE